MIDLPRTNCARSVIPMSVVKIPNDFQCKDESDASDERCCGEDEDDEDGIYINAMMRK